MSNQGSSDDMPLVLLAETENFAVLVGEDDEGESIYNLEFGSLTLHLFPEEWAELVDLVKEASKHA